MRGISGGEKKRLSFASEVCVTNRENNSQSEYREAVVNCEGITPSLPIMRCFYCDGHCIFYGRICNSYATLSRCIPWSISIVTFIFLVCTKAFDIPWYATRKYCLTRIYTDTALLLFIRSSQILHCCLLMNQHLVLIHSWLRV